MTIRRSRALYIGIVHWSRGGEELLQQLLSSCDDESYAHVDCHKDSNPNALPDLWTADVDGAAARSSGRPTAILGDEASLATIETVPRRAGIEFIDEYGGGPGVRFRKGHHKRGLRLSACRLSSHVGY